MDKQKLIEMIKFERHRKILSTDNSTWNEDKQYGYIKGLETCYKEWDKNIDSNKYNKWERAILKLAECIDSLEYPHVVTTRNNKNFRTRKELIEGILNEK
jgi:hypothetical protein